ncbi:MAG: alcohol dehydrogenase catalytic domain-containing protein [Dehalococcoidia bacterium]|nr:alcohol dehydrogenase catalytic domain-containing protein [Dehalococcoidia bacterium]
MKAFTVMPGVAGSGVVREVPDAKPRAGEVLVRPLRVGVDGTDRELLEGRYGESPPGAGYLITGHEALGRVISAPRGHLEPEQLVVPIVRRPDPGPCLNCAAGEWDMCRNGRYTERGAAQGPVVRAAATVTLALPKAGLLAESARVYLGQVLLADIGIPDAVYRHAAMPSPAGAFSSGR